jgi:hypothetical protein
MRSSGDRVLCQLPTLNAHGRPYRAGARREKAAAVGGDGQSKENRPSWVNYNFVRVHKTLRTTPAMAAKVTERLWEIGDIVGVLEAWEVAQVRRSIWEECHGMV